MNTEKNSPGNWFFSKLIRLIKIFAPSRKKPASENISPQTSSPESSPESQPESESPLMYVPDASADIYDLDKELHIMQDQHLAWPFSPAVTQHTPDEIPSIDENRYWEIARKIGSWALLLLCFLLAALPPFFVFLDRWLGVTKLIDAWRETWCRVRFLCEMWWPSYFIIIVPVSILLVVLVVFVIVDKRPRSKSPEASTEDPAAKKTIRPEQQRIARTLQIIAIVWAVILLIFAIITEVPPGIGLLPAILIYFLGRVLAEYSSGILVMKLRLWWHRFWPLGLTHLALILFLIDISNGRPTTLITFTFLLAALVNLWKHRAHVNIIHWITLAAVILFTININSWFFSTIGDEYGFFSFGKDILLYQNWDFRSSHFFSGMGVYGSHPYFSSVIHAISMMFLGIDNFGWRFSSLYLAALSIPMFYFFFRRFLDERVSLIAAGMLGCSHYLMTFGKIGYNNLQALFVMGLVLWATGEAVHNRRLLNYTVLGFSLSLVFYVYPAAFYVLPLSGILLLMYDPPFNKNALQRWLTAGIAFLLLFFPLLLQPDYWHDKVSGTLFYNIDIIQQEGGIALHLARNFLYSIYSFIYIVQESHYVTSSYVDPISAILVFLGLAWVFKLLRRDRFALFILLGFLLLNFFVGASHDRSAPPNTRMFLLLPWFTLLASLGLSWLTWQLQRLHASYRISTSIIILLLSFVLVGNLYQAYGLQYKRNDGHPSLEVLFLRMLQRDASISNGAMRDAHKRSYIFITNEGWDIGGLRTLQEVYGVPDSDTQLQRVAVSDGNIPSNWVERIQNEDIGVIVYPHMEEEWLVSLQSQLADLEKKPCIIRNTPTSDPRFTIWWSERWINTCPAEGDWEYRE